MRSVLGLALCTMLVACGDNGNSSPDLSTSPDLAVALDMATPPDLAKGANNHMCTSQTDTSSKCLSCVMGVLGQGAQGSGPCKTQMATCLADTSGSDYPAPDGGMLSCKGVIDCLQGGGSQGSCLGMASSTAQGDLFSAFGCGNGACQNM